MIKILFVVPYPEIGDTVTKLYEKFCDKEKVKLDIILSKLEELEKRDFSTIDADVIVARGYTSTLLKNKKLSIPIITLNISVYDAISAIDECREKYSSKKIGFVGHYQAFSNLETLSNRFGCEIKVYSPDYYTGAEEYISKAMADGCDTIVGGYAVSRCIDKFNINFCLVKSVEATLFDSLSEAIRTAEAIQNERIRLGVYQTIIQSSSNGVIFVNSSGIIKVANAESSKMFRKQLSGQSIENIKFLSVASFKHVLTTGKAIEAEIFNVNETTLSASYTPVSVKDNVVGVVITIQNVTKVQKLENIIRQKLSKKGHFAKHTFDSIMHKSSIIDETINAAKLYALSNSNIMIVGETGTGKELFAQSIHNASNRKDGPFVAINCAALPENLLESELFGYVGGAFTGAEKKGKTGLFELAHNGTLFLDEIGEISLSMQSKLLRVLQEKEIRRIGDDGNISIDVRIICATNKNLKEMIKTGDFREDLFYRLDVLKIYIPPLRKRAEDIPLIFNSITEQINNGVCPSLEEDAQELLKSYRFSGNVRELENIAERVCVINKNHNIITKSDLEKALFPEGIVSRQAETITEEKQTSPAPANYENHILSEKDIIIKTLAKYGGNKTKAAADLNMDRSTLWRKLKKYNIN